MNTVLKDIKISFTIILVTASVIASSFTIYISQNWPLDSENGSLWILLLTVFILIILPFCIELKHKTFDMLNAKNIFCIYILMQFVLWPIWVILGDYRTFADRVTKITFLDSRIDEAILGLIFTILGLLAFYLGYYILKINYQKAKNKFVNFPIKRFPMNIWIGVFIIVGFSSFFIFLQQHESIIFYLLHIDLFRSFELLGVGYLFYGMYLLLIAFQAVFIIYAIEGRCRRLAIILFGLNLIVSLFGAYRHMTIEIIASAAVIYHYARKRIKLTAKLIFGIIVFLILNILYVSFRGR